MGGRSGTTGRECYHCGQWVEAGSAHDCWTTTEAALTRHLPEDLRDAWERLRETAAEFGEQRIYASHNSIMFSRTACYCFVRPRLRMLEVWFFLGRTMKAPQVRRTMASSRTKVAHLVQVRHRDEVEAPLTDWLREAYERSPELGARRPAPAGGPSLDAARRRSRRTRADGAGRPAAGALKPGRARQPRRPRDRRG